MPDTSQITFQIAFDLYQKQSSSLDELWNFYATVALALLSAVVASDRLKSTPTGMRVIVGGFVIFAISNLVIVLNVHDGMLALATLTNDLARKSELTAPVQLKSTPQWAVGLFHVIADIAFVLAMWLIYRSSREHSPPNA